MAKKPFGRPKMFKLHRDEQAIIPQPDLPFTTVQAAMKSADENTIGWLSEHGKDLNPNARTFYAKTPANFNDPRVVFYILDMLVTGARGIYFRAPYMQYVLEQKRPQYYWDAGIVGRTLAGIATACQEAYFGWDAEGRPLEYVPSANFVPFARSRDTKGYYYVIDPQGGNEGLLWLLEARRVMYELSEQQMVADLHGKFDQYFGGVTQPANWFTDVFSGPIRGANAFKGQLTPDQQFDGQPRIADRDDVDFVERHSVNPAVAEVG